MRKNVLAIISFLAVAANLIVPGLAFGQSQQSGTQQVNCGYLTLNAYPANDMAFSFSAANVSTGTQYTFGNQFTSSSDPYQNGTNTLPAQAHDFVAHSHKKFQAFFPVVIRIGPGQNFEFAAFVDQGDFAENSVAAIHPV